MSTRINYVLILYFNTVCAYTAQAVVQKLDALTKSDTSKLNALPGAPRTKELLTP